MDDKIEVVNQPMDQTYDDGSDSCKESLITDGQVLQFYQEDDPNVSNLNIGFQMGLQAKKIENMVKNKEDSSKKA
jgi:hypothetical protein